MPNNLANLRLGIGALSKKERQRTPLASHQRKDDLRVACIMMQKNERDLLAPWIAHHSRLFGAENLYVFDNGSTDKETISILQNTEQEITVNFTRKSRDDFERKGEIIAGLIKSFDKQDAYDIIFPLDCDEFVGVELTDGSISVDRDDIMNTLSNYRNDPRVLMIQATLDNNPIHDDYYHLSRHQRKCFFARGSCKSLDTGFHIGKAKTTDETVRTPIVYFHMHHRPFRAYRYFAMQKMLGRLSEVSRRGIEQYGETGITGSHLVAPLLMDESEFNARYLRRPDLHFPLFRSRLANDGHPLEFSENYPDLLPPEDTVMRGHRGFIDMASIKVGRGHLVGWGTTPSGAPAIVSDVRIGSHRISRFDVATRNRPDVEKVVGPMALTSGFEINFSLSGIPEKDLKSRSLSVLLTSSDEEATPTVLNLAQSKEWPFDDVMPIVEVPPSPAVLPETASRLEHKLSHSSCYLEYGTGGSTIRATELGVPVIIGVESDAQWLDAVRQATPAPYVPGTLHLIHADIGTTSAWGHPANDSHWRDYWRYAVKPWEYCRQHGHAPDLVFIDGRFRVACFLATLLNAAPGATILFDDWEQRSYYRSIIEFAQPDRLLDGLAAEFTVPGNLPRDEVWLKLLAASSDPR